MKKTFYISLAALALTLSSGSAQAVVTALWTFDEFSHGDVVGPLARMEDTSGNDRDGWSLGDTAIVSVSNPYGTSSAMSLNGLANMGLNFRAPFSGNPTFGLPDITAGQVIDWDASWTSELVVSTTQSAVATVMGYDAQGGAAGGSQWSVRLNAEGTLDVHIRDTTANTVQFTGNTAINDGDWHHIALVHNSASDTLELFVDYVSDGSASLATLTSTVINGETDVFRVGMTDAGAQERFAGLVDFVRVSDAALSPSGFVQPIPEPASLVLMGMTGLLLARRSRR